MEIAPRSSRARISHKVGKAIVCGVPFGSGTRGSQTCSLRVALYCNPGASWITLPEYHEAKMRSPCPGCFRMCPTRSSWCRARKQCRGRCFLAPEASSLLQTSAAGSCKSSSAFRFPKPIALAVLYAYCFCLSSTGKMSCAMHHPAPPLYPTNFVLCIGTV